MNVKGAFDHFSKIKLISHILELRIDGDLISYTKSFLTD